MIGVVGPGEDLGILDEVGFKNRIQTDRVKGIVKEHAVQHHLVHDGGTTADVQLPALVTGKNNPRQNLQILGDIGLPTYRNNLGNLFGGHRFNRNAGIG